MHLNMQVFKHGKPIYWVIGAVIIFVIFWKVASGSSKSSGTGTITTVQSGPSDAQISAAAGITQAQIAANAQHDQTSASVAVATLEQQAHIYDTSAAADTSQFISSTEARAHMYDTAAAADVANLSANLGANVQLAGIAAQEAMAFNQNEYSFATARVAAETSLAGQEIQAGVIRSSFDLQAHLSDNQTSVFNTASNNQRIAYVAGEAFGNLDKVKANDRDNIAALALAAGTGMSTTYTDRTSGSFSTYH